MKSVEIKAPPTSDWWGFLFVLLRPFCYNGTMNNLIKSKLELLPTSPGCYIHKDKNGTIIYVGKAKNLRNRVRSYFRGSHDTKTEALVSEIVDFEFIVTESNIEALLLEINLIKENKPKYNIMLKDDKSYPFIKITNERYPRLIITRQVKKDGGLYFGPYPDVGAANEIKRLLDRIFPFRKCTNPPSKVCFYYHIGQCMAHTICKKDVAYFKSMAQEVSDFLKGQDDKIIDDLKGKMAKAAQSMEFERAAEYRDLIQAIGTLRTKQRVMAKDLQNRDVFGYYVDKGWMCVQVFFVRQGKLIERDVNLFPYYNDPDEDFLTYVGQFYQEKSHLVPNEVLIPQDIDEEAVKALVDTKILKPQRGEKKQLVNLAIKNARVSLEQKFNLLEKSVEKTQGAIENLGRLLQIPTPVRIESFDNSNIMGTSPVSAMVVFVNGKPSKKDYRKYKIKTVVGPDDYASMREVIRRRYGRVQRDGLTPPDLIVIDGGQGQVNIAKQVIQEELGLDIPIAGLQKNDKHQTHELLFGDPLEVVELSRNSQEFFLLQRIQDEVHRFAITFHRQLRSKNSFSSQLDGIEGLGPKRKQNLMKHFKSLTKIKEASVDEIVEVGVPRAVAEAVQRKLNPQEAVALAQVAEPLKELE
ncbi:Excinuclease ABC subunit C [Streptococcus oralis]|uniref:UvrABC system protein C n=2 Tax=Streptococcus oralis TaxID=1303 RepID=A0A139P4B0_STROR|nr:Excinuclease ABC subunit C [Streptococcus oralis]